MEQDIVFFYKLSFHSVTVVPPLPPKLMLKHITAGNNVIPLVQSVCSVVFRRHSNWRGT